MKTFRRLLGLGAAFGLSLLLASLLLPVSPAAAHTGFESSEPADGATTSTAVSRIVLRFTGTAEPVGEGFVILTSSGVLRMPDSATPNGDETSWTLAFEPPISSGVVGVRWTVQAPDAHPITGSLSFTVDAPTTASVEPEVAATDESERDRTATTAIEPDDSDQGSGAPTAASPVGADDQSTNSAIDLDEFLGTSATTPANAQTVATLGSLLRLAGTALAIGGLAFAFYVVRDRRPDVLLALGAVRYAALVIALGAAIDLVARLAMGNGGWSRFWSESSVEAVARSAQGLAIALQIGAGVLLFITTMSKSKRLSSPAQTTPPLTVGVVLLLASFAFDGHTATEGNRWVTGVVDVVHVAAGSVWAGGVVFLAVVLWHRHRRSSEVDALHVAVRFSVVAGAALAVAGLAGTALAVIILNSVDELWSTSWGRLLIAKFVLVVAAASVGAYNHFVALPRLEGEPGDKAFMVKLRNTASGEALLLIAVVTITAFLVGASVT